MNPCLGIGCYFLPFFRLLRGLRLFRRLRGGLRVVALRADLAERADVLEVLREGDHAARGLLPVVVLVRGVVAVLGKREAEEEDRRLEDRLHREDGADRAPLADEDRLLAEGEVDRGPDGVRERAGRDPLVRVEPVLEADHDVRVLRLDELRDELRDLCAALLRDEAAGDLDLRARRDDRLDPGACVAADEAVQLEGRHRPDPLHDVERVLRPDPLEEVVFHEAADREARALEVGELLLRRRDHVVVEAGDLHAPRRRVEALRDELRQLGNRVPRCAARDTRVLVGRAGLEREGESLKPAEARRGRRLAAGDPDRVGDDDRVGREQLRGGRDPLLEARGADLLLELPEDADVDGHLRRHGGLDAEERGEGGALVVSRAAAEVPVPLLREDEGLRLPRLRLLRRRLDVEVVVDGHCRPGGVRSPHTVDDRVAVGLEDRRRAAELPDRLRGELRALVDGGLLRRVGGDRRDLDELLQEVLERFAVSLGEGKEAVFFECGAHAGQSTSTSRAAFPGPLKGLRAFPTGPAGAAGAPPPACRGT